MKKTLILLVLTLGLALWVWWFEVRPETRSASTDEAAFASKTLTGVQQGQIQGFTLSKAGEKPITLRKVQGDWALTSPVDASADPGEVNRIVADFEWTEKAGTVPADQIDDAKAAAFGLDKPRGTFEILKTDETSALFIVGGSTGIEGDNNVYVREGESGPVHIVPKRLAETLDTSVLQLRNRSVVTLAPAQIAYMKLLGRTKATLEKQSGLWNLTEPFVDYADPQTVTTVLKDVSALRIVDFVDDNPEDLGKYGLAEPASVVTVNESATTGKSAVVQIGSPAGAGEDGARLVYAKLGANRPVFTLRADDIDRIFRPLPELQCKTLTRLDPYTLRKVTLTFGLNQVDLVKADYDWRVSVPYDAAADNEAVSKAIDAIQQVKIEQFLTADPDATKYGFETPQGSFSYVQADKAPVGLVFGADADEATVYVRRTDTPGTYRVSKAVLDVLKTPALVFHTLDMQITDVTNIETLTIERPDRTYVLTQVPGEYGMPLWKVLEPVKGSANDAMMHVVTLGLATLRAESLVTDKSGDLAQYGLDAPSLKAAIKTASGDAPRTLLVGKSLEGGKRYAMLEGDSLVFVLPATFASALFDEARDPRVLAYRVTDAEEVQFLKGAETYTIKKDLSGWQVTSPEGGTVDQSAVARELSKLSTLLTPKFETFETADLAKYGLTRPQAVVRVVNTAGRAVALSVGSMAPTGHYYATSTTTDGVFLLTPADVSEVLAPDMIIKPAAASETAPAAAAAATSSVEVSQPAAEAVDASVPAPQVESSGS